MKQGQASAGKSQPLSVNRGQAYHAEVEVEPGELEIQEEELVEDEVVGEEVNEQQEQRKNKYRYIYIFTICKT